MKKLSFIILFVITGLSLSASDKAFPAKPSNLPDGVKWNSSFNGSWDYRYKFQKPYLSWYRDGSLSFLQYETENKNYVITEKYYKNGNLEYIEQALNPDYYRYVFKKYKIDTYIFLEVVKQQLYYKNGKLKEERSYTPVVQKDRTVKRVLCGSEVFDDETGKETKRIEHNVKCEYVHSNIQRKSVDELVAIIKSHKDMVWNENLMRHPVVGEIASLDSSSREIKIAYKPGFELAIGDQVFCFFDGDIVTFECKGNDNGRGSFELVEDKAKKYLSINEDTKPRFFKANEVKYTDVLKSGGKPKSGDVKVIAGIEFVYIPEGEYYQYDDSNSINGHKVHVAAFWMTKYEVTLGEYLKYSYEKNSELPENKTDLTFSSRYPAAVGYDYFSSSGFSSWFGKKHGVETVPPKAYEWEYAARGGTTTDYYWGNGNINDYCWYSKNSGGKLHPVGQKKPNAFGLYDMIGNAWEWCDIYTLRGGSCQSDESYLQYSWTYWLDYQYQNYTGNKEYLEITSQGTSFRMIIREAE